MQISSAVIFVLEDIMGNVRLVKIKKCEIFRAWRLQRKGFRETLEKYQDYKKVWDACEAAGIDIPDEVVNYFGDEAPDGKGIWNQVKEDREGNLDCEAISFNGRDGQDAWIVDLRKLPEDIKLIKFVNSY